MNPEATSAAIAQALCKAEEAGFVWHPCKDAPNSYKALREAYEAGSVPISSAPVFSSIYATPECNVKARALHDWVHLTYGYDFSLAGETQVARVTRDMLLDLDVPLRVVAAIFLDTYAQAWYYAKCKEYVKDQRLFIQECLDRRVSAVLDDVHNGRRY